MLYNHVVRHNTVHSDSLSDVEKFKNWYWKFLDDIVIKVKFQGNKDQKWLFNMAVSFKVNYKFQSNSLKSDFWLIILHNFFSTCSGSKHNLKLFS